MWQIYSRNCLILKQYAQDAASWKIINLEPNFFSTDTRNYGISIFNGHIIEVNTIFYRHSFGIFCIPFSFNYENVFAGNHSKWCISVYVGYIHLMITDILGNF